MKQLDWHIKALLIISVPFVLFGLAYSLFYPLYQLVINHNDIIARFDIYAYLKGVERLFDNPLTLYDTPKEIGKMWFIYPPPGIVFFIPFYFIPYPVNYYLYKIILIFLYVFSIVLVFKSRNERPKDINRFFIISMIFILSAISPLQKEVYIMNANTIFMFMAVLSYFFMEKKKLLLSMLALSYGFWMKLYPVVLFSLYLKKGKGNPRIVLLAVFSMLVFVLVLLPLLPLDLYSYYFLEYMNKYASFPQASSLMNLSLMNFIHHFFLPKEALMWWHNIEIPANIKMFNLVFSMIAFGGLTVYNFIRGQSVRFFVFSSILALTSVVSITGWEFVYVCAMPLFLYSLIISIGNKTFVKISVFISILAVYITKPPTSVIAYFNDKIPFIVQNLFYFRMILIVFFLIGLNFYLIEKGLWGKYGSFLRNDAKECEIAINEQAQ